MMNEPGLKKRKEVKVMKESEYTYTREKIEAECKRKLDALNLIYEMIKDYPSEVAPVKKLHRGEIGKRVWAAMAIHGKGREFTVHQIRGHIIDLHPEYTHCLHATSISSVLGRLVKQGSLIRMKVGRGTRPSIYKEVRN